MNILFNCAYLETKIAFHVYEKLSLKINMPYICDFKCEEWFYFFLRIFFLCLACN
jgi:hypothetical protein